MHDLHTGQHFQHSTNRIRFMRSLALVMRIPKDMQALREGPNAAAAVVVVVVLFLCNDSGPFPENEKTIFLFVQKFLY